jgi:hypothetical protein
MIQIDTANYIRIDGKNTGLQLTQRRDGTVIYSVDSGGQNYREYPMPHARYSTAHDYPASGAAGRAQLEADVRALLETL